MFNQLRIIVAQVQASLGDVKKNTLVAKKHIINAQKSGAALIVFPELFLTGYPPEDLLYLPELYQKLESAKSQLADASSDIDIVIGAPTLINSTTSSEREIYNSAWYFSKGKLRGEYHKTQLPNYGVFDERRYFKTGRESFVFQCMGVKCMLAICEDLWGNTIVEQLHKDKPELLIAINASPFEYDKLQKRQTTVTTLAKKTNCAIAYANLVGSQDDLVFDGASFCCDKQGNICGQAREMGEHFWQLDFHKSNWLNIINMPVMDEEEKIFQALVMAVRNYVHESGMSRVIIGLSGGIDSAVTLAVAVAALGADCVTAVIMPYIYTRDISTTDALKLATNLGVEAIELPIHQAVKGVLETMKTTIDWQSSGGKLALQNVQARCRGNILMSLANAWGALVLTTGNKSEMAMGYATLYGDMAGGYAVLKDLDKNRVYKLARWCNRDNEVIVQRIIDRQPSAELAEDQLDSDSLPDYEILDQIVCAYVEKQQSLDEMTKKFGKDLVSKVVTAIDRNEYKRRQAPPGPKITTMAFDRERRVPVTNKWHHDF